MGYEPERSGQKVTENFFGRLESELLDSQEFDSVAHSMRERIDDLNSDNNHGIRAKRKGLPPVLHRQQALSRRLNTFHTPDV